MDKRLGQMKEIMTGDDSKPPATLCVSLAAELQKSGIVLQLLQSMELLQFEARKDWVRASHCTMFIFYSGTRILYYTMLTRNPIIMFTDMPVYFRSLSLYPLLGIITAISWTISSQQKTMPFCFYSSMGTGARPPLSTVVP